MQSGRIEAALQLAGGSVCVQTPSLRQVHLMYLTVSVWDGVIFGQKAHWIASLIHPAFQLLIILCQLHTVHILDSALCGESTNQSRVSLIICTVIACPARSAAIQYITLVAVT